MATETVDEAVSARPDFKTTDIGSFYRLVRGRRSYTPEDAEAAKQAAIELGHSGALEAVEEATETYFTYDEKFEALKRSIETRGNSFYNGGEEDRPRKISFRKYAEWVTKGRFTVDGESHEEISEPQENNGNLSSQSSTGVLYRELFWSEADRQLHRDVDTDNLAEIIASQISDSDDLEEADSRLDSVKDELLAEVERRNKESGKPKDEEFEQVLVRRVKEIKSDLDGTVIRKGLLESEGQYKLSNLLDLDRLLESYSLLDGDRRLGQEPEEGSRQYSTLALSLAVKIAVQYAGLPKDTLKTKLAANRWKLLIQLADKYLEKLDDEETIRYAIETIGTVLGCIEQKLTDDAD